MRTRALRLSVALAALAIASCTTPQPRAVVPATFKVAITIDDLPVHGPIPAGMTALQVNRQMVEAIKASGVNGVTAFVNGRWVGEEPTAMDALQVWKAAGIPLANHTWSHPNLNALSVAAYEEEIARNEPLLKGLNPGDEWRWFRFPFLAEGDDPAKRGAIRTYLAGKGYRIASVSLDFSDWKFTAPYARCKATGNEAAIRRMERMYLDAARAHVRYSRTAMKAMYGHEVPLVELMHVGAFSAHMMPRLIDLFREEGAQFVSLAEAQADPAYAEDNDPRLPPRSQFIGQRAQDRGIAIAPPADQQPELDAMCPGAGPMLTTP